jgi:hypothetical protein
MRRFVAGAVVAAIVIVLGIGLLPPLMARGKLNQTTMTAAQAGYLALVSGGGTAGADSAALGALAKHPNVTIVSMGQVPGVPNAFAVTTQEHVHTFMDHVAGLKSWFTVTSTQMWKASG